MLRNSLNVNLGYIPGPYKPPFDEEAPTDPDIEKMIQIVCINKIRPTVDDRIGIN